MRTFAPSFRNLVFQNCHFLSLPGSWFPSSQCRSALGSREGQSQEHHGRQGPACAMLVKEVFFFQMDGTSWCTEIQKSRSRCGFLFLHVDGFSSLFLSVYVFRIYFELCWDLPCPEGAQSNNQNKEHTESAFHSTTLKDMMNLFRLCFKRWYSRIL